MPKTIFITGASTGLGKHCAILFAQKGWNVIATMRKPADGAEIAALPNISVLALDVTDLAQIDAVVADVTAKTRIDVVFNNAGYGLAGPFEGATDAQLERQIDTNLLGVMRVTKAFLPHFRANKGGTFITTTSIGGHVAFPFNSVYHATKWALEGWSESLAYECAPFGIRVKTVAPGGISTDFASRSLVMTEHAAYKTMVDKVLKVFMDPKRASNYSTADQIAEVVWTAATDGTPTLRYIAGKDAKLLYRLRRWFGYKFFMRQIEKRFFK
jgi:NAD(P)-dependent dehydrogenase (short-subunit alcohol dehydrogenase family)